MKCCVCTGQWRIETVAVMKYRVSLQQTFAVPVEVMLRIHRRGTSVSIRHDAPQHAFVCVPLVVSCSSSCLYLPLPNYRASLSHIPEHAKQCLSFFCIEAGCACHLSGWYSGHVHLNIATA